MHPYFAWESWKWADKHDLLRGNTTNKLDHIKYSVCFLYHTVTSRHDCSTVPRRQVLNLQYSRCIMLRLSLLLASCQLSYHRNAKRYEKNKKFAGLMQEKNIINWYFCADHYSYNPWWYNLSTTATHNDLLRVLPSVLSACCYLSYLGSTCDLINQQEEKKKEKAPLTPWECERGGGGG